MGSSADRSGASLALVIAVVGALGVVAGNWINAESHKGDIDAKLIELSVGILRTAPTKETGPLREWAIDVIEKRGDFNFSDAQRAVLLNQELPFKGPTFAGTPTTSNFSFTQPFPSMPAPSPGATTSPMPGPPGSAGATRPQNRGAPNCWRVNSSRRRAEAVSDAAAGGTPPS